MDGVEADVDDPGQDEGGQANAQEFVAECCSQDLSLAELVHEGEALGVVHADEGGHGQAQQEDEEQTEVETLPHQGGLVQDLLLAVLLQ